MLVLALPSDLLEGGSGDCMSALGGSGRCSYTSDTWPDGIHCFQVETGRPNLSLSLYFTYGLIICSG